MKQLAILLSEILFAWLAIQLFLAIIFLSQLREKSRRLLPDEQLPKTAVILSLLGDYRGSNPSLFNSLQSLLKQNYPRYDLKIIVDNVDDYAWKIANDTIKELKANHAQISSLKWRNNNCSLKCISLVQAVSELDITYQVVALVNADTVVHPDWLRELVNPLIHPKVGATTSIPWYIPNGRYWGTLVRYLWNIPVVVQMCLYRIPWNGTLAIKRELFFQAGLLEKWGQSYAEDILIHEVLKKHGLQVKFVPSLIMLNREECRLPNLIYWLRHQFFAFRLYHPQWWAVVIDSFFSIVLPNALLLLSIWMLFTKQWQVAVIFSSAYCFYMLVLVLLAVLLEFNVQKILVHRGEKTTKLTFFTLMKIFLGGALTQCICGLAMISSWWISKTR
jgi:cellulose synthase/poly-beta-1,6-N-acetylglucosamine synthase-like glycosyltransferase